MLEARSISKSFRGLRAVHAASFSVPEGSFVALIGPNGAGKTTISVSYTHLTLPTN